MVILFGIIVLIAFTNLNYQQSPNILIKCDNNRTIVALNTVAVNVSVNKCITLGWCTGQFLYFVQSKTQRSTGTVRKMLFVILNETSIFVPAVQYCHTLMHNLVADYYSYFEQNICFWRFSPQITGTQEIQLAG